ncbi:glycosyltransferase, partial [archaeon]|nr:glycosyltransferase [archaeon]
MHLVIKQHFNNTQNHPIGASISGHFWRIQQWHVASIQKTINQNTPNFVKERQTIINIIIINWNTGTLLKKCLLSLLDSSHRELIDQVVIVDNNSSDSSIKQAKYAIAGAPFSIQFLHLRSNVGFAAANNLGIIRLKQTARSSSHFLLLNPDTELIPQSLSILTTVLEANPDNGIVGPKIMNPDGSLQPSVRNLPTLSSFIWQLLKLYKIMPQAKLWRTYLQSDFD